ncbi:MAG: 8-oxo-dGTP diphosphatase, partial [Patescibacteria group bacterium]|nr:8-oxo-dGTP diphosphatase [Patescibacteria group bacterium]
MPSVNPKRKILTLCVIHQKNHEQSRILLGMKKKGFGAGRWNGFGGKVEEGETVIEAAAREVREEAGVEPGPLTKRGILEFTFENDPVRLEVHVFSCDTFTGRPAESDEMKPEWFDESEIPYAHMWSDDSYWMPMLLSHKNFRGSFHFDRPSTADYQAKILKH